MKLVQLSEVAWIVMGTAPPSESYNDLQEGLPLIAGASDYGLENPKPKRWTSQASAISEPGDLIICVRATIGDLNWSDRSYCLGRGVAALRPDTEKLNPQYLGHYMNAKKAELSALGTGSTFPAIRKNDLESFQIPLPPLPEQKRIADILDKADAIRRKRREASAQVNQVILSTFMHWFGNPVVNNKSLPTAKLSDVATLDRGKSRHRPRDAAFLYGGDYPFIQTGDIANSDGYIQTYRQTYSEDGLAQSKLWPKGTLCITIAANIAKTSVLTFDACFPDSVVGLIPGDRLSTPYIRYWFVLMERTIEASATQVAQKNINLEVLRSLEIMIPPAEQLRQFTELVEKCHSLRRRLESSVSDAEKLFSALIQQSFTREV